MEPGRLPQPALVCDRSEFFLNIDSSRILTDTESLHFTLAFHATERPDDPPIGVWKFDRTDFDEANLDLQQRGGYSYARIARLEYVSLR